MVELKVQEATQITIDFNPKYLMNYSGELKVSYHTGEEVFVTLRGTGISIDVRINKYDLKIPSTYIAMANYKTFRIENKGTESVQFYFSAYSTPEDEEIDRQE